MGTIRERERRDGSIGYTAQIILRRKGKPTHREAATFDRRGGAVAWMKNREAELKQPGGIEKAKIRGITVGETIDRYVESSVKKIGRTKAQVLRSLKKYDIADIEASEVASEDIVRLAQQLGQSMKPQTVQNYLSHLGAVFAIAKPAWGIPLDAEVMKGAFSVTKRLGLTGKSEKRERRPTLDELNALMTFFYERRVRSPEAAPMHKIIAFAIFSTRRQDEIVRPLWSNLDEDGSRVLIKDMKHPGQKIGNDVWCELVPEALSVIRTMPRTQGPIFPYTADAISASFTRACYALGINKPEMEDEDRLHFHDLRHEGVSRLFEMGWSIPRAAGVSGHRSWASLQRYTHIRQVGDKYANWKWLKILTGETPC